MSIPRTRIHRPNSQGCSTAANTRRLVDTSAFLRNTYRRSKHTLASFEPTLCNCDVSFPRSDEKRKEKRKKNQKKVPLVIDEPPPRYVSFTRDRKRRVDLARLSKRFNFPSRVDLSRLASEETRQRHVRLVPERLMAAQGTKVCRTSEFNLPSLARQHSDRVMPLVYCLRVSPFSRSETIRTREPNGHCGRGGRAKEEEEEEERKPELSSGSAGTKHSHVQQLSLPPGQPGVSSRGTGETNTLRPILIRCDDYHRSSIGSFLRSLFLSLSLSLSFSFSSYRL